MTTAIIDSSLQPVEELTAKTVGSKLKSFRKEHQLTQGALASRLRVTRGFVSTLEQGRSSPGFETMQRIQKLLASPQP